MYQASTNPLSLKGNLHNLLRSFLGDVAALRETFELVVPILEEQDKLRLRQHRQASEVLKDRFIDAGAGAASSNIPEIIEATKTIRGHEHRLRRGRVLFQGNSIVALVSRFDDFFAAVMRFILRVQPGPLAASSISYLEVSQAKSVEELLDRFVKKHVENVLRESHTEQFKALTSFTGKFDEPELLAPFLEITERRNLHVHTGGRVSSQYIEVCQQAGVKLHSWLKKGAYLPVDRVYFKKACITMSEMAFKMTQTVMRKLFPKEIKIADASLLGIGVDFLQRDDFRLAEMVFDYGVGLNQNWTSNDGIRKAFVINKATALKFSNKNKECLATLDKTDWSSAHPKFVIAVHVLRDEIEKATTLLKTLLLSTELSERNLLEWPVFRRFRESEQCRSTFREVEGRELGVLQKI